MEETYYYADGKRVNVFRLRSARVVPLPEERNIVTLPGWNTVSLGNKRFQLMIRADTLTPRSLSGIRLKDLTDDLIAAEKQLENRPLLEEERSINSEFGENSSSALLTSSKSLLLPTGEIAARFKADLNQSAIEEKIRGMGGIIIQKLSFLPNTYLLKPQKGGDGLDLANRLVESGLVEFASPNFIEEIPFREVNTPQNRLFAREWHLNNTGQGGAAHGLDVDALDAWQITIGSPDIIICILDSGIDSKHEAFSNPEKLVPGFDFEDEDTVADPTTSSHGTSCAGVAAAPWNIAQVVGIAPACRLMPIRRTAISENLKMAEAFVWAADHGADIISCSFGYDNRSGPWILPDIVRAAIDHAADNGRNGKGCIIFWAGGNGNESITTDGWACYEKNIAVAAVNDQGVRAYYSDFGPEVSICAPSNGGKNGIMTTSIGGYTDQFGGTSSAAPLAAGIAALQLSVNPNLTRQEVKNLILQSADKIDPENGAYDATGHSDFYGQGKVNAFKAVAFSVLTGAWRESGMDIQLPSLLQFSEKFLSPLPSGQVILDFLKRNRVEAIKLLQTDPSFRKNAVIALNAVSKISSALQSGKSFEISDSDWSAITSATKSLLKITANSQGERSVNSATTN